jgi:hypothetical protein
LYIGPPSKRVKLCPETLIAVTMGDCAVIFASAKTEQYNAAASFAWPLNQRQGVIFSFIFKIFISKLMKGYKQGIE